MTLQRPMQPPPAADQPANLPDSSTPPKPQKRPAKRRNVRRRKGSYYPANITLDDFFKAYYTLPPVESGKPERWTATELMKGANLHPSDRALRPAPLPALEVLVRLREEAAAEIDRLLAFLDATEPDVDLELSMGPQNALDECEPDDGENEDGHDDEPSLGFLQRYPNGMYGGLQWDYGVTRDFTGSQEGLCQGLGNDLEEEHDGGEPDVENEPSLGSLDAPINQERAWCAENPCNITDGEVDAAESGIADADGLLEQRGELYPFGLNGVRLVA